jgi:vancomycin resistance protein VanJ
MSDLGPRRYRIVNGAATPIERRPRWPVTRIARVIVPVLCWIDSAFLLGFYLAARFLPAEFWPVHLVLYGPRWVAALPLILLVSLAAWLRLRWSALALGVASISFFGILGFNVPWKNLLTTGVDSGQTLRVLTCNVQGGDLKIRSLADFVEATRPDVVCLQECNLGDPLAVLSGAGWHCRSTGEFCLASRYPVLDFDELRRPDKNHRLIAVRARLSRSGKAIPLISVHLMTPRRGLQPILDRQEEGIDSFRAIASIQRFESQLLRRWVEGAPESIVLAGDFNLTAEHSLFRRDWSGYRDAFTWTSWGLGHTMFTRHIGLRIDHILCGPGWIPRRCEVGPDVGSAHVPVVADLVESP